MGELIRFRPRQGARTALTVDASGNSPTSGEARILLFTGVRYERHEEPAPARKPRSQGRNGRRKRA